MFGWKKDIEDTSDKIFTSAIKKFAAVGITEQTEEYYLPEYTPISNQLDTSTCVANASADALEIIKGIKDHKNSPQLSRLFLYWNARVMDNSTDKDEGTYIRNAFSSLSSLGVCLEDTWKFEKRNLFKQPPIKAYKEASDNTIVTFYRIKSNGQNRVDEIISAIKSNHPVVFGTLVNRSFCESANVQTFDIPSGATVGGHAMVCTGFKSENGEVKFLIRNSWGTGWGNANGMPGHCWMSEKYMTWQYTEDLWVPTDMPELLV